MTVRAEHFSDELGRIFASEEAAGSRFTDVNSGNLQRRLGDYPNPSKHRMPECCRTMYRRMGPGDEVLSAPPSGKGASVTIRYRLPRR